MDKESIRKLLESRGIRVEDSPFRESEWMREYRYPPNGIYYESKFVTDGLKVSAASIKTRWPKFTRKERKEFARAFGANPRFESEDQEILKFLLEVGTEEELNPLLIRLPRYSDREYAISFLLQKLAKRPKRPDNYYQALELMGDARGIPLLRERFEKYRKDLAPFEKLGLWSELPTYQTCCRALWKLTGSQEYESAIRELLTHPDEHIRKRAQMLLTI